MNIDLIVQIFAALTAVLGFISSVIAFIMNIKKTNNKNKVPGVYVKNNTTTSGTIINGNKNKVDNGTHININYYNHVQKAKREKREMGINSSAAFLLGLLVIILYAKYRIYFLLCLSLLNILAIIVSIPVAKKVLTSVDVVLIGTAYSFSTLLALLIHVNWLAPKGYDKLIKKVSIKYIIDNWSSSQTHCFCYLAIQLVITVLLLFGVYMIIFDCVNIFSTYHKYKKISNNCNTNINNLQSDIKLELLFVSIGFIIITVLFYPFTYHFDTRRNK